MYDFFKVHEIVAVIKEASSPAVQDFCVFEAFRNGRAVVHPVPYVFVNHSNLDA